MKARNSIVLLLCALFVFQSCSKKDDFDVSVEESEFVNLKAAVASLGFDTTGIFVRGDEIFVEEDIALKKSQLFKTNSRQAVILPNQIIGGYRLRSFTYFISNTLTYHAPVEDAMREFRSIFPNSVTATRVFNESTADLVFRGYNEVNHFCGYAIWPTVPTLLTGGVVELIVGESVNINLYHWRNLSNSQRKALIAHEVGHAIGVRHTNWRGLGEGEFTAAPNGGYYQTYGAYTVPNTSNTGTNPDPSSIFNGGTCGRSWGNGFTEGDRRAVIHVSIGY
ncbi:M57 family metalloprotease [Sphingobacterium oryzagri]|uniref:M57 family metalloprotease n=1 Tax=Sphingobacterium oryzagri TaxID=3025669 RepID=A0ABY7WF52_9SPHI|nr:M57 family metalloprotease [Sphingobacterium sp. KACC 22765]WDF68254.1 M57 family metalloprotease [Sphingobacterium sp. KACC 22765]